MKNFKLKYILTFVLASLIFSCSGDDSDDVNNHITTSEIVGSWRLVQEVYYENGEEVNVYNVPNDCDTEVLSFTTTEMTFEFDDDCDGTFDFIDTYAYTISGNEIFVDSESAEISVNSTTLTLAFYYDTNSYEKYIYERL